MKTTLILLFAIAGIAFLFIRAQKSSPTIPPSKVDFDAFEKLTSEVKEYRKSHLVDLNSFLKMSTEENVIILDTRSDSMYASKHVKGARHLNFSDFTQFNLARIIPSADTKVLIYCNNNFSNDQQNFATKYVMPEMVKDRDVKPITLALNIPTFINLYGYGYRNVYELSELVSVNDPRIEFEGKWAFKFKK
ncbi:MAG TPA: rhodanese-like domain-containing protein [Bacteroidia bacterium]|jgi:hypothetical protein